MTVLLVMTLLLGAVPAAYTWWSGRAVARALDDPTLPEQLLARQRRMGQVTLVVLIAGAMLSAPMGFTILVLLALLAAQYPTRRAVYGDSWSLWQYLRYTSFSSIAFLGLWLYPLIASGLVVQLVRAWMPAASTERTLVGLALGAAAAVVYLVWHRSFVRVWLALNQASPIEAIAERSSLLPRFAAVLDRAGDRLPRRPTVHRYGAPGGRVINAAALCSLRDRAVVMSDTLLAHLDDDEATAIFAHEVAHHEHYTDALLRRRRRAARTLALVLATIPALQLTLGNDWDVAVDVIFLVVILALFARGLSRFQKHETECDLRAVELTGDADAVIRGLSKIHALGRMPRRFSQEFERAASHPSLARRIQAIRAQAPAGESASDAPTILASRTAGAYVVLDDRRIHWLDGVPEGTTSELSVLRESATSYRALAYAELGELRLETETPRALRATDLRGASWSVPIRDADVAAVQAALDRVDTKLGRAPRVPAASSTNTARTIAALLLLATMLTGTWGIPMLLALVAMAAPTAASMSVLAVVALGRGLLASNRAGGGEPFEIIALATTIVAALLAAFVAWRLARLPRSDESVKGRRWRRALYAVLALGVVVALAGVADDASSSPAALLGNADVTSGAITMAGLGVALLFLHARAGRVAGAATLVVAGVGIVAGTIGDRLAGRSSPIAWTTGRLSPVVVVPMVEDVQQVELSPAATRYLTRRYLGGDDDEDVAATRIATGSIASPAPAQPLDAIDAALPNEREVLALRRIADSLELRLERLDADSASRVAWRRMLPALAGARLTLDVGGARWLVSGRRHDGNRWRMTTIDGATAGGDVRTRELAAEAVYAQPLHAYHDGTTLVAAVAPSPGMRLAGRSMLLAYLGALRGSVGWTMSRVDASGMHLVARLRGLPTCDGAEPDSAVCVEQWPRSIRVWRVPRDGTPEDLGVLPSRYDRATPGINGRVVAWSNRGGAVAIVDVGRRRGVRTSLPDLGADAFPREVSATDAGVAVLVAGRDGMRLALYRLTESR